MYNFFIPPQASLQKILSPSPVDHPPTAGIKITNPYGLLKIDQTETSYIYPLLVKFHDNIFISFQIRGKV